MSEPESPAATEPMFDTVPGTTTQPLQPETGPAATRPAVTGIARPAQQRHLCVVLHDVADSTRSACLRTMRAISSVAHETMPPSPDVMFLVG